MSADVIALHRKRGIPKKRRSAVSAVSHSGLELVPRRKRRGKFATARTLAKLNFKPWPKSNPPDKPGPSAELMHSLGISARLAAGIVQRPKRTLVKMHETIEHEAVGQLMDNLFEAAETLKSMAHMIEVAYLRVLMTAAHLGAGGKFKGGSEAGAPIEPKPAA